MSNISRNAPCPCGSGKKYKQCCLQEDREEAQRVPSLAELDFINDSPFDSEPEAWDAEFDNEDDEEWGLDEVGNGDDEAEDGPVEEDEDENGSEAEWSVEPATYPSPEDDYPRPEIPGSQEAILDAWWAEFMPYYKRNDVDEMIRRIVAFMEERPNLFAHLGLDGECLFELGAELGRRGEYGRFVELLLRIRREHPEAYVPSHGFFDLDIVSELLVTDRRSEIPQYLDLFKRYPDSQPDQLKDLLDLLLATNCQEEAFELARATAEACVRSAEVWGGDFARNWVIFEQWIPFLETGDAPEAAACGIHKAATAAVGHYTTETFRRQFIVDALGAVFDDDPAAHFPPLMRHGGRTRFYQAVTWRFMRFLHDNRGMTWATARFFTHHVENYLYAVSPKGRRKRPFPFEFDRLDRYLARHYLDFSMWVKTVGAFSLLLAVYEFAGYIEAYQLAPSEPSEATRETCLKLFEFCRKAPVDSLFTSRVFDDFPAYRWSV